MIPRGKTSQEMEKLSPGNITGTSQVQPACSHGLAQEIMNVLLLLLLLFRPIRTKFLFLTAQSPSQRRVQSSNPTSSSTLWGVCRG